MLLRSPRVLALAVATLTLACLVPGAHAFPVMNFDGYPSGTAITNQYQPQGVLYASAAGSPCQIFLDAAEATSGSNILIGASVLREINLKLVDPATGAPSAAWRACHVSMNVISAGWSVVQVSSKDAAGTVLESFTVTNPAGPENGLGKVNPLDFSVGSIASVSMIFTTVDFGDGIGLDDVVVDFGCATPTTPSTWGGLKSLYR